MRMHHSRKCVPFSLQPRRSQRPFVSVRDRSDQWSGVRCESEHVTVILYAYSHLRPLRQIAIPFSMSLARHTRRTLGTFMRCTMALPRSMACLCSLYIRNLDLCFQLGRGVLLRESYPGVSRIYQCKEEGGCLRAWNW